MCSNKCPYITNQITYFLNRERISADHNISFIHIRNQQLCILSEFISWEHWSDFLNQQIACVVQLKFYDCRRTIITEKITIKCLKVPSGSAKLHIKQNTIAKHLILIMVVVWLNLILLNVTHTELVLFHNVLSTSRKYMKWQKSENKE